MLCSLAKSATEKNRFSLLLAVNRVGLLKFSDQSLRSVVVFLISDYPDRNPLHANKLLGFVKQNYKH